MKKSTWLAVVFNPLAVFIYSLICSIITIGVQYGNLTTRIPFLLTGFLILFLWFAWCLYHFIKFKRKNAPLPFVSNVSLSYETASKLWLIIAGLALFSSTVEAGTNIYQNAAVLREEAIGYVDDLKNTRQVTFVQDNLYDNGLQGLFADIQEEISLPQDLYLAEDFELLFSQEGQIIAFHSSVYGVDEEGKNQSYMIAYDSSQDKDIQIRLDRTAELDYDEGEKLLPLVEMLAAAPLKETVSQRSEDTFRLVYNGLYNWGDDSNGILSLDSEGNTAQLEAGKQQIIGYTVTLSTPENPAFAPIRYIQLLSQTHPLYEELQLNEATIDTFYLNTKLGYHLKETDAAMGSLFYALEHTYDGGNTWVTINSDPFSGNLGIVSGITFIDKDLGFIGLAKSGGSYAELYQTKNGGTAFEKAAIPPIEVPLTSTQTQMPFDFPEMPYQENGKLMLLVNQGQDGDYNGGSKALYQSTDNGDTWTFVEEVNE